MAKTVKCFVSAWITMDVGDNDTDGMVKEAEQILKESPESVIWDNVEIGDIEVVESHSFNGYDPDESYEAYRELTRGLKSA